MKPKFVIVLLIPPKKETNFSTFTKVSLSLLKEITLLPNNKQLLAISILLKCHHS